MTGSHSAQRFGEFGPAFLGLALSLTGPVDAAQTLTTPSYTLTIDVRCEEGVLGCPDVAGHAVRHHTREAFAMAGEEVFRPCGDGVTPCQFLYYRFEQNGTEYLVGDDGTLTILRAGQVQLQESGEWRYDR